ncbi:MAG: class I adenylate-forming enzyme family protein [Sphingomonadaceae bacterium]
MDVTSLMRKAAKLNADRTAVVHGDRRLNFSEAWDRSVRLANALIDMGMLPGDRIAILEDNCIESSDIFQAAAIANLVRVPLYARNSAEAHTHMMGRTGCKALILAEKYLPEVEDIIADMPELKHVIVRDAAYEAWLARQSPVDPLIPAHEDDIYIIRHTGGTTGNPKGIAYSHRGWNAVCREWFYIFPQVNPGDACLHVGPISHGSGYQYLPVWLAGGCNVMMDHFEVDEAMRILEQERIAFALLVPAMLASITRHCDAGAKDFSALKCVLTGTGPIQDSTILASRKLFGDILYQGYGQTEISAIAFMGPQQWFATPEGENPLRACGMVLPFANVEIWDEDNKPLPLGEPGEIVAKSDGRSAMFWDDDEAMSERIVDGWVKTGDIGRLDRYGYLYLLDRSDDKIISGGFNIWPSELENVIARHPAVLEVVVFGVPHEKWGETPMAACVVKAAGDVSEREIVDLVAEELGSYKKPGRVEIRTDPLPRSPIGKIRRRDMREPFWVGYDRRIAGA